MLDKRLLREARHVTIYILITVLLGVGIALLVVAQAYYLAKVINASFLEGATFKEVQDMLLLLLGLIVLRAVMQYLSDRTAKEAAIGVKEKMREKFLNKLVANGPVYVRGERAGELLNTAIEGIEALDDYFTRYIPHLLLALLVPLLVLGFVLPKDLQSAIVLILTGPLIPLFMILIGKLAEKKSLRQWQSLSRMSAHFFDMLQGLTTLKLFARSKDQTKVIARVSDAFRANTLSVLRVSFLSAFMLEFMGMLSTAIIAVFLGVRLIEGAIPYTEALFILIITPEFYLPLRTLGLSFHAKMSGTNAANRIFEVLELAEDQGKLRTGEAEKPKLDKENVYSIFTKEDIYQEPKYIAGYGEEKRVPWLTFKNLSLSYGKDGSEVLQNINMTINYGESVALIGPSGSGKSSLLQLLLRFVEPTCGEIFVNNLPLKEIPPEVWREMIAYVPQKPYLFYGTILESLRFGRPEATLEEVRQASQLARIHDYISKLPQGYDTLVSEAGRSLSGGQVQRLAIARAFLKDAPFLLLDEVTSGLDNENERELLEALEDLCQGRTVLFTTHRMKTTIHADRILIIEKGRIIDEGSPQELLGRESLYAQFLSAKGREEQ